MDEMNGKVENYACGSSLATDSAESYFPRLAEVTLMGSDAPMGSPLITYSA